jgi:hypothetical protein
MDEISNLAFQPLCSDQQKSHQGIKPLFSHASSQIKTGKFNCGPEMDNNKDKSNIVRFLC